MASFGGNSGRQDDAVAEIAFRAKFSGGCLAPATQGRSLPTRQRIELQFSFFVPPNNYKGTVPAIASPGFDRFAQAKETDRNSNG